VLASAFHSKINPCVTTRKRIGVWNCHATSGHRKTTVFTSVVYGFTSLWNCWMLNVDDDTTACCCIMNNDLNIVWCQLRKKILLFSTFFFFNIRALVLQSILFFPTFGKF
jgi:hypothetical protein